MTPAAPSQEEVEGPAHYIPVKAYFLSTRGMKERFLFDFVSPILYNIDLKSLQAEHGTDVVPPSTRSLNYIALRYSVFPPEIMDIGVKDIRFCYRYLVVFQYGSAVLFNIVDHEAEHYLEMIRNHASGWLPEMRKDDYAVVEKPSLTTWMKGGLDYIVLRSIDTDGIRIISSVLGQSIALDHYIQQVFGDANIDLITPIVDNGTIPESGQFDTVNENSAQHGDDSMEEQLMQSPAAASTSIWSGQYT
ncbi:hypothetical protein D1007_37135 [Hordeum vulgare]|nr:hypothetical protein D1007_37135 [Hordeum vulgare]